MLNKREIKDIDSLPPDLEVIEVKLELEISEADAQLLRENSPPPGEFPIVKQIGKGVSIEWIDTERKRFEILGTIFVEPERFKNT